MKSRFGGRTLGFVVRGGAGVVLMCPLTSPALAIDGTKASDTVDRSIYANPSLVVADAAMSRAYFALLRTSPEPEIHDMLVHSQRRWIEARNAWLKKEKVSERALHDAMLERAHVWETAAMLDSSRAPGPSNGCSRDTRRKHGFDFRRGHQYFQWVSGRITGRNADLAGIWPE